MLRTHTTSFSIVLTSTRLTTALGTTVSRCAAGMSIYLLVHWGTRAVIVTTGQLLLILMLRTRTTSSSIVLTSTRRTTSIDSAVSRCAVLSFSLISFSFSHLLLFNFYSPPSLFFLLFLSFSLPPSHTLSDELIFIGLDRLRFFRWEAVHREEDNAWEGEVRTRWMKGKRRKENKRK